MNRTNICFMPNEMEFKNKIKNQAQLLISFLFLYFLSNQTGYWLPICLHNFSPSKESTISLHFYQIFSPTKRSIQKQDLLPRWGIDDCDGHAVRVEIIRQSRWWQHRCHIGRKVFCSSCNNQAWFSSASVSSNNNPDPSSIPRICSSSWSSRH